MTNEELELVRDRWTVVNPDAFSATPAHRLGKADVEALLAHIDMLTVELYPYGTDTPQQIVSSAFACADARCNVLLFTVDKLDMVEHEQRSMRAEVLAGRRALRIAANGDPD